MKISRNNKKEPFRAASSWPMSALFLALIYCSSVIPSFHFAHNHGDESYHKGILSAESGEHFVEADPDDSSEHHHHDTHDADGAHDTHDAHEHTGENDHEHTYVKHDSWQIIRTQSANSTASFSKYLLSSTGFLSADYDDSNYFTNEVSLQSKDCITSATIIRGPPLQA